MVGFNRDLQALMNEYKLAWGTQYEITRFFIKSPEYRFTLDEYRTVIPQLQGDNVRAKDVRPLLKPLRDAHRPIGDLPEEGGHHAYDPVTGSSELERIKEFAAAAEHNHQDPWSELDREELHLDSGDRAGHGLSESDPTFYGGQGMPPQIGACTDANFALLRSRVQSSSSSN